MSTNRSAKTCTRAAPQSFVSQTQTFRLTRELSDWLDAVSTKTGFGAVSLAGHVEEPLLICEAVLAEAAFHLGSVTPVFAMLQEGLVAATSGRRFH